MITTEDARRHVRIDGTDHDHEIEQKLDEAIAIACVYTGSTSAVPFDLLNPNDDNSAAQAVELAAWQSRGFDAAVLLIFGELWACRESGSADPLSQTVRNILNLYRAPDYA